MPSLLYPHPCQSGSAASAKLVAAVAVGGAGLPLLGYTPATVRHYHQAGAHRARTDAIHAETIARLGEATHPSPRPPPDAATRLLADLVPRRRQIIVMMVAERQRATR